MRHRLGWGVGCRRLGLFRSFFLRSRCYWFFIGICVLLRGRGCVVVFDRCFGKVYIPYDNYATNKKNKDTTTCKLSFEREREEFLPECLFLRARRAWIHLFVFIIAFVWVWKLAF